MQIVRSCHVELRQTVFVTGHQKKTSLLPIPKLMCVGHHHDHLSVLLPTVV